MVRWFRNTLHGSGLEFGCELLSDTPEAAAPPPKTRMTLAVAPDVVLLPATSGEDGVAADGARRRQALSARAGGHAAPRQRNRAVVLTKLVEQGPGFELYEFVVGRVDRAPPRWRRGCHPRCALVALALLQLLWELCSRRCGRAALARAQGAAARRCCARASRGGARARGNGRCCCRPGTSPRARARDQRERPSRRRARASPPRSRSRRSSRCSRWLAPQGSAPLARHAGLSAQFRRTVGPRRVAGKPLRQRKHDALDDAGELASRRRAPSSFSRAITCCTRTSGADAPAVTPTRRLPATHSGCSSSARSTM